MTYVDMFSSFSVCIGRMTALVCVIYFAVEFFLCFFLSV